jgi:lipoate-protein ligase A
LTYSLALPLAKSSPGAASELYTVVHESLVAALVEFGVQALMHRAAAFCRGERAASVDTEPFLCFERRACGDILCDGAKIVGSAQRRRQGAVLQHGSMLLSRSPFAPELPGIAELAGSSIRANDLAIASSRFVSQGLRLSLQPGSLSEAEQRKTAEIQARRFAAEDYLYRR